MAEVIQFPEKVTTDEYFGGCPTCGKNDGYFNVHRTHWMVCNRHKTRWMIGSNLFSSWKEETEADWKENMERKGGYAVVRPVNPEPVWCDRCEELGLKGSVDIAHNPLCQIDGKLTELSDDEVKRMMRFLHMHGLRIERLRDFDMADCPF